MFKFFDKSGQEVFSSKDLAEVETEAKKYKKENNLLSLEICKGKGKHFKWI